MAKPKSSEDKVRGWVPFYDEFVRTRNILILVACAFAIAIGVIIALNLAPGDAGTAMSNQGVAWFVFVTLLLNAGFGIGVSLLISTIILRDQRFEVQMDLDRRIDLISQNVFQGVLSNALPADYAALATRIVLTAPVVRRDLDVRITMTSLDGIDRSPRARKFTLMDVRVSCTHENISTSVHRLPVSVSLPNPIVPKAKELVKLKSARVGTDGLTAAEIKALNTAAQIQLSDNSNPEIVFAISEVLEARLKRKIELPPGQSLHVDFSYEIVKEEEDNELILTALPTQQMTLNVNDKTGRNLILMAKSIHSSKIGPDARPVVEEGWAEWKLRQWAFPRQGIIFWWKLPPFTGVTAAASPAVPAQGGIATGNQAA